VPRINYGHTQSETHFLQTQRRRFGIKPSENVAQYTVNSWRTWAELTLNVRVETGDLPRRDIFGDLE